MPRDLVGIGYSGVMVHDGFKSYECFWKATHQHGLFHLIRRTRDLCEEACGGAVTFPPVGDADPEGKFECVESLQGRETNLAGVALVWSLSEKPDPWPDPTSQYPPGQ